MACGYTDKPRHWLERAISRSIKVPFPELDTLRLRLTSLVDADVDSIFQLFSNSSVIEYYDLEAFDKPSQTADIIRFFSIPI